MALLRTAAQKLAAKTVFTNIINKKVITNLNDKKANRIARLANTDLIAEFIKGTIDMIKQSAVEGKCVYITDAQPKAIVNALKKVLKNKKYKCLGVDAGQNKYRVVIYWGPNTKVKTKLKLSDIEIPDLVDASDIQYQIFAPATWQKKFLDKQAAITGVKKGAIYEKL